MYFNKLVELQSYTEVSEYFGVSQPTISIAIHRLEHEFNTELINRNQSHHHIKINQAGATLYTHTRKIATQIKEIQRDMDDQSGEHINFGMPPIIAHYYFPELAVTLRSDGILDSLDHVEGGSASLLERLKKGSVDVALLGSATPLESPTIEAQVVAQSAFKLIVAKDSPLAQQPSVKIKDLENQDVITFTPGFIHQQVFADLLKEHSLHVHVSYTTSDVELLKQLVSRGVGAALLTDEAIQPSDDLVAITIADDELPPFYVSVAYRKSHVLTPKEQSLIAVLSNHIQAQ
ncbi:LysR family transcriptional regulator [Fructilactobacillus myrtifloralis]|uniref:LysR family transcriptional regulator n=1 Tax=Fructilactobacillus myrtifloralis TaxID=2940301 RepID=UPI00237D3002|nr:LysR family transcriptional regulator [Fructilactobacillus myrtifloralis]